MSFNKLLIPCLLILNSKNFRALGSSFVASFWPHSSIVSCGGHSAESCFLCPGGYGSLWCNGDCIWENGACHYRVLHRIGSCDADPTYRGRSICERLYDGRSCTRCGLYYIRSDRLPFHIKLTLKDPGPVNKIRIYLRKVLKLRLEIFNGGTKIPISYKQMHPLSTNLTNGGEIELLAGVRDLILTFTTIPTVTHVEIYILELRPYVYRSASISEVHVIDEEMQVSCGGHTASSCSACAADNGAIGCNGDCYWSGGNCILIGHNISTVSCGGHQAGSCLECPQEDGDHLCNGDCVWYQGECVRVNCFMNQDSEKILKK